MITLERLESLAAETAEFHGLSITKSRALARLAMIKVALDLGISCTRIHEYLDDVSGGGAVPS